MSWYAGQAAAQLLRSWAQGWIGRPECLASASAPAEFSAAMKSVKPRRPAWNLLESWERVRRCYYRWRVMVMWWEFSKFFLSNRRRLENAIRGHWRQLRRVSAGIWSAPRDR